MRRCWERDARVRPSFASIDSQLTTILNKGRDLRNATDSDTVREKVTKKDDKEDSVAMEMANYLKAVPHHFDNDRGAASSRDELEEEKESEDCV